MKTHDELVDKILIYVGDSCLHILRPMQCLTKF